MRNDNRAVIAIKSRSLIIPFHLKTNCFRQTRGEPFKVLIKASVPYRKTYSSFALFTHLEVVVVKTILCHKTTNECGNLSTCIIILAIRINQ